MLESAVTPITKGIIDRVGALCTSSERSFVNVSGV